MPMGDDPVSETQRQEFNCLVELYARYRALPAIVADDYPSARRRYEEAMNDLLRALVDNRYRQIMHILAGAGGPLTPHAYVASALHMGDCAVCGQMQGAPVHNPFKRAG